MIVTTNGKTKKETYNSMSKQDLIKLKEKIKTELQIVQLTSDDKIFLDVNQAIIHQSELEEIRTKNRRWKEMKLDIVAIVLEILEKNRWGIYFKTEPMQKLPTVDSSSTLYKVNEVSKEQLSESIKNQIEIHTQEKESEWENHQAKNQSQTDNESSSGIEKMSSDTKE